MSRGDDDVGSKDDASTRREAEENGVGAEDNGGEQFGTLVHGFEVHFLTTGAGEHGSEFEPDEETAEGEGQTEDP